MTTRELLQLLVRRWYVVLLGTVVSLLALFLVLQRPGVYWSQTYVLVLSPIDELNPNNLEDPPYTLPPVASLLVSDYNKGKPPLRLSSSHTTMYGEGLREGSQVRLRNNGNQWVPIYNEPMIDVQALAASPGAVEDELDRVTTELARLLEARQDELGIRDRFRLTTTVSPSNPVVHYISGSRSRVLGGMALLGATSTVVLTYWLDMLLLRRSLRREQHLWAAGAEPPRGRRFRTRPGRAPRGIPAHGR